MNVSGQLAPDGYVPITCPNAECGKSVRVRPKSARTGVTCKACQTRFVLEVTNFPAETAGPESDFQFNTDAPISAPAPSSTKSKSIRTKPAEEEKPAKSKYGSKYGAPVDHRKRNYALLGIGGVVIGAAIAAGVVLLVFNKDKGEPIAKNKDVEKPKEVAVVPPTKTKDETPTPTPKPKNDRPLPKGKKPAEPEIKGDPKEPFDPVMGNVKPGPIPVEPMPEPKTEPKPEVPPKVVRPEPKPKFPFPDVMDMERENDPKLKEILTRTKKATPLVEGAQGAGSGFVIRPGILVTNAHVIDGEVLDDIKIRFVSLTETDPKPIKPILLYKDKKRDLAIFRIPPGQSPLELTDSGTELEGLRVAVVGNPMQAIGALKIGEVTFGEVKAPARLDEGQIFFQLDARAAPGNSGGPVIDEKTGKVVGVLTAGVRGRATTWCIPYTDVAKALTRLVPPGDKEADGLKVTAARHYLEMISSRMPEVEENANFAMELQRMALKGEDPLFMKGDKVFRMQDVMKDLKEKHGKAHKTIAGLVQSSISPLKDLPEPLKAAARTRLETCTLMRQHADAKSNMGEGAFAKAMDQRKSASEKAVKVYEAEFKKYQEQVEKKFEEKK